MRGEVHAAEVADGVFVLTRVQRDFGTEVRGVNRSRVVLRRANVTRVLERQPRVARLEQSREGLSPQFLGIDALVLSELAPVRHLLVLPISLLERRAGQVVKVGHFVGAEQRPFSPLFDALHEQIRNPRRRVHVRRASAFVARVPFQVDERRKIEMPAGEVATGRSPALAGAVDGRRHVVADAEERHDAGGFDARGLDERAARAEVRPVVAEAAAPLRESCVTFVRVEDVAEVIGDGRQVTRGQLRVGRPAVEQRRRGGGELQFREHVVELLGPPLRVVLFDRQPHRDAHPERLW